VPSQRRGATIANDAPPYVGTSYRHRVLAHVIALEDCAESVARRNIGAYDFSGLLRLRLISARIHSLDACISCRSEAISDCVNIGHGFELSRFALGELINFITQCLRLKIVRGSPCFGEYQQGQWRGAMVTTDAPPCVGAYIDNQI